MVADAEVEISAERIKEHPSYPLAYHMAICEAAQMGFCGNGML
jgi:hypothetical protein